MNEPPYLEALSAFANSLHDFSVGPVPGGLINHSYKISNKQTGDTFLLQQINRQVFPEPGKIQENYQLLCEYIAERQIPFLLPELKYFPGRRPLYTDREQRCWRVFSFVEETLTLNSAGNPEQAAAVAETFARFTAAFNEMDCRRLHIIIPGFHHLSNRFSQFRQALSNASPQRLMRSGGLIRELNDRERYARLYDLFTGSPAFPLRVMHHDAKISNVLFDLHSGNVICPVDFDTAMPGYFFSDLGDMIRSMAGTADENNCDFGRIEIRPAIYQAILEGYLEGMGAFLTPEEKKYIHSAGLLLVYMQALRFLADYLDNDVYYRTSYPGQNLDRAGNQLALLNKLEEFLADNYKFTC
ncbi:MAG: aminoglycoside phosphotransferase family protein [Sphingobacteriales bacterium]|nr:aminoglycoside phosphotransferase family protein [Sphingobacteriales bacterium]